MAGVPLLEQWRASGREVAVVGLGKSGVAATLLLRDHGDPDLRLRHRHRAGLRRVGRDAAARPGAAVRPRRARPRPDRAVGGGGRGAGRAARRAAARGRARRPGVPIHAEVDIGFLALRGTRCIGITGTNGKTTTTSLDRARAGGRRAPGRDGGQHRPAAVRRRPVGLAARLAGARALLLPAARHARTCEPAVGVLTNLAPNHLDRYHTLEEYYGDKALLFRNADAELGLGQQRRRPGGAGDGARRCRDGTCGSRCEQRADGWFDRAGGPAHARRASRCFRAASCRCSATTTWPTRSTAALAARAARVRRSEAIAAGLRTFRAIPHRVEPVREVDGVLWINDSKSTNITSTEVAVAALDRPFVLLLGGRHKGEPYTRLAEPLAGPLPRGGGVRRGGAAGDAGPGRGAAGGAGRHLRRGARHRAASWPGRATRCCCRPPAPATTCSRTTRSAARASAQAVEALVTAARPVRHPGEMRWETRLLGMVTARAARCSASPRPTAPRAW